MVLNHQLFDKTPTASPVKDYSKLKNDHHLLVNAWSQLPEQKPDGCSQACLGLAGSYSYAKINSSGFS